MKNTEIENSAFSELIKTFERELVKGNKSETYISEQTSYIKEFLRFSEENGISSIAEIGQAFIDSYILHLGEARLKKRGSGLLEENTINKHKNVIRQFWKYLHSEEIKYNVVRLRQKKQSEQKHPTVLTHEEIEWLYSVCDDSAIGHRDRCTLALYYGCGMRKSEGLRLQITDIDFGKGRIHVRKTKNNRERYVMMSPVVQKQVEEYVYSYRDFYLPEGAREEGLFIGERGKAIKPETMAIRIETLWERVKDRYGSNKHIGCHTLRHSLGTHLYMAGMAVEMIALMLGHRTLEATQLYIHSANELKR